jgi:predicted nucleic acid-binding protein
MEREQAYWDSNAFLGHLLDEAEKVEACRAVLKAAENGQLTIVTSAMTLAEVLYLKGGKKLDPADRIKIDNFFRAEYISVRNVTRGTADLARDAVWDLDIRPVDALHVATACMYRVPVLHTYDDKLLARSGLTLGGHTLTISKPHIAHQVDWVDDKQPASKNTTERPGDGSAAQDAKHATEPPQETQGQKGESQKGQVKPEKPA